MARGPAPDEHDETSGDAFDPVVRMPKRMYVPPAAPETPEAGARVLLLIAVVGATLGGLLGALGITIVWATLTPQPRAVVASAPAPRRPRRPAVNAGPAPPVYELDTDAGTPSVPTTPGVIYEVNQQPLGHRMLADALRAMGLPQPDAVAVVRAFQGLVNMRALQPDDRVAVMREPISREIQRVEYRRTTTQVWAAVKVTPATPAEASPRARRRPAATTWRGERVEVVLSTVRLAVGFRVDASVTGSLLGAGLQPELGARLAEVFRAIALPPRLLGGDTVRVVVEEERINGQFYRYARVLGIDYDGAWGHRRAYQVGFGDGRSDYFDEEGRTFEQAPLHAPIPGARMTAGYDPRRMHPTRHVPAPHNGVDFEGAAGAPVFAAADGVVSTAGVAGASGNLVTIEHRTLRVFTGYAHLSRIAPGIRAGVPVRAGQLIGNVGNTGRSFGAHLHFSTKRNGLFCDPVPMLGIRRAIREEARALFDARSRLIASELERVVVDGRALVPPDAGASSDAAVADAGEHSPLAPLEVGTGGVDSEGEALGPDARDPLDETGEVQ